MKSAIDLRNEILNKDIRVAILTEIVSELKKLKIKAGAVEFFRDNVVAYTTEIDGEAYADAEPYYSIGFRVKLLKTSNYISIDFSEPPMINYTTSPSTQDKKIVKVIQKISKRRGCNCMYGTVTSY